MSGTSALTYGIMAHPGHNRVYFDASVSLSLAELTLALQHFQAPCGDARVLEVEGLRMFAFSAAMPLTETDLTLLSRLSFVFGLFLLEPRQDSYILAPIRKRTHGVLPEDVSTILKYTGKTNELFTRLLLNVGLLSGAFVHEPHIRLLDPVAGKGTTLFEAAINGWDACGVEISEKAVSDARTYFKKYLETGKYKHTLERERLSGEGRHFRAVISRFSYAVSKEAVKSGESRQLVLVEGDSRYANHYFKHNHFHLIVGDLPYGVQHGSHGAAIPSKPGAMQSTRPAEKKGGNPSHHSDGGNITRNPRELVQRCLPAWVDVLKPGGTLVLSWNRFVLERDALAGVLRERGLTVLDESPYRHFVHRVDQAINRDVMVARKETHHGE